MYRNVLNRIACLTLIATMLHGGILAGVNEAHALERSNEKFGIHSHQLRDKFGDDGVTNWDFIEPVTHKTAVPNGYVGIYTLKDLDNVRNNLEANYILMNNINLSAWGGWEPIGTGETGKRGHDYIPIMDQIPFKGIFDGNGYVIRNMSISRDSALDDENWYSVGLFGAVENATIKNVGIVGANISIVGYHYTVGTIVGSTYGISYTTNCFSTGEITQSTATAYIGGIAGCRSRNVTSTHIIEKCYNAVNITSIFTGDTTATPHIDPMISVGGVAMNATEVNYCYNVGKIEATISGMHGFGQISIGGITSGETSSIDQCSNSGNITALIFDAAFTSPYGWISVYAGGIAGNGHSVSIENCANQGNIVAGFTNVHGQTTDLASLEINAGGIVAHSDYSIISDCLNSGRVAALGLNIDSTDTYAFAGGLAGVFHANDDNKFQIKNSYNLGDVVAKVLPSSGDNKSIAYTGGLAGNFFCLLSNGVSAMSIVNCYNRGNVTAEASTEAIAGGIISVFYGGIFVESAYVFFENCYNTGIINAISDNRATGGIAGSAGLSHDEDLPDEKYLTFKNCYYSDASEYGIEAFVDDNANLVNVTPLTEMQMREQSSYVGFDFDYVWSIDSETNNGYPYLRDYVPLTSISFDNAEIKMNKGETQALTITYSPINTTERAVTWSTSDSNIVSIDMDGVITARGVGTATITARVRDKRATCTITVTSNFILGDVNRDGKVNAGDAAMILQWLVKLRTIDDEQIELADFNCDGKSDAGDASAILKWCVGLWP